MNADQVKFRLNIVINDLDLMSSDGRRISPFACKLNADILRAALKHLDATENNAPHVTRRITLAKRLQERMEGAK